MKNKLLIKLRKQAKACYYVTVDRKQNYTVWHRDFICQRFPEADPIAINISQNKQYAINEVIRLRNAYISEIVENLRNSKDRETVVF